MISITVRSVNSLLVDFSYSDFLDIYPVLL